MSEPTNAERVQGILTGDSGYMAENEISHILVNNADMLRKIRTGELIVISRERVKSIHADLVRLAELDKPEIIRTDDWGDQ